MTRLTILSSAILLAGGAFSYAAAQDANADPDLLTPQQIYDTADWAVHLEVVTEGPNEDGRIVRMRSSPAAFIIRDRGETVILTVAHIQKLGDTVISITVHFRDYLHLSPEPAYIFGNHRARDIALLRFSNPDFVFPGRVAQLGSAYRLRRGETVVSLGSPMPIGEWFYLTSGEFDRLIEGGTKIKHFGLTTYGNSGGPLVNLRGEVVGMNFRIEKAPDGTHSPLDANNFLPPHGLPCPYSVASIARPIDTIRNALPYLRRGIVR